jgi:hypothetical protein
VNPSGVGCPGCGLVLPDTGGAPPARLHASAACQAVHDRVAAFEAEHPQLGRFRQMRVDIYGAQHAGGPTPVIRVGYGLVGLHLALDRGVSGEGVRRAHSMMGKPRTDWPGFGDPPRADVTVLDVARDGADGGTWAGHADAVVRWARSVWAAWAPAHDDVAALTRRLFTGNEPFWGSRDTYRP